VPGDAIGNLMAGKADRLISGVEETIET